MELQNEWKNREKNERWAREVTFNKTRFHSPLWLFFFPLGSESNSEAWKYFEGLNND